MKVLRTDDSVARQQRIQAAIGQKLEFETPRRRPDIQFIFAPSQYVTARQLRPQLRYQFAGDIPTYTLGDAYEPHPSANQEIEGMMFPDMPWMLGSDGLVTDVREAARQAFGDSAAKRGRLFAFGLRRHARRGGVAAQAARSIRRASPARSASTRRAACAASSTGCASRAARRRRSTANARRRLPLRPELRP